MVLSNETRAASAISNFREHLVRESAWGRMSVAAAPAVVRAFDGGTIWN